MKSHSTEPGMVGIQLMFYNEPLGLFIRGQRFIEMFVRGQYFGELPLY